MTKVVFKESKPLSINREFTISTNVECQVKCDFPWPLIYSIMSTKAPTQSKAEIVNPKEILVSKIGNVQILPAPQGPLCSDMVMILKGIFGAGICANLKHRSRNSGGHPNLDILRTLGQCQVDGRLFSKTLPRLRKGDHFLDIDIGAKYGAGES
jgi:hypothetical protein